MVVVAALVIQVLQQQLVVQAVVVHGLQQIQALAQIKVHFLEHCLMGMLAVTAATGAILVAGPVVVVRVAQGQAGAAAILLQVALVVHILYLDQA